MEEEGERGREGQRERERERGKERAEYVEMHCGICSIVIVHELYTLACVHTHKLAGPAFIEL